VLGLPERPAPGADGEGLDALELGDAVHLELERADGRWRTLYPHARPEDSALVEALLANWRGSALAARVDGSPRVRREVPFAFDVDGVVFRGRLDVLAEPGGGQALIVDYKTNRLGERLPDEVVEEAYGVQVTTYALAALRGGRPAVEVAYAFLERPDAIVARTFEAADCERLEAELREAIESIRAGRFQARPGAHCQDCPALDLLCAGPRLGWEEG
jgi:RecB family exonuclease